jgi:hypothetical protein
VWLAFSDVSEALTVIIDWATIALLRKAISRLHDATNQKTAICKM